ncbi:MAG: hypothetical protein V2I51_19770, partial [Anderseniella sp.]|nr:hypothetical protein [Anderseniella sp.]
CAHTFGLAISLMAAIPYRKWQNVPGQLPHRPVNTTVGLLLNGLAAFAEWNGAAASSPGAS